MAETKRYYWLKLPEGFFNQKEIKTLRKIAGGDTFTIIYLKMLLTAMKDDGKLYFEGYGDDFASELAMDIDEDIENVRVTVRYLITKGILVENSVAEYEITTSKELTGSEGDSARRMRRSRLANKLAGQEVLPPSQCDAQPSQSDTDVTKRDVEIEIDIDKEKRKRESKRFTPPTVDEVRAYVQENGYDIDPEYFVDSNEAKGWVVGQQHTPMKDWKAVIRTWVRNDKKRKSADTSLYNPYDGLHNEPDDYGGNYTF